MSSLRAGDVLPEYRVRAHNGSTASDNRIHDDTVARQYGFAGGLVPGVTIHAYMTHPVVEAVGLDWIERGAMSARFLKPFYEGDEVTVRAAVNLAEGEGVEVAIEAVNQHGDLCAAGWASLRGEPDAPEVASFPELALPGAKPPASEAAFAASPVLGSLHETWDAGEPTAKFLAEIADDLALYRGPDAVAHPGYLVRKANFILSENVTLGPWIHVSSSVQHLGLVRHGERLSTRARVTGVFERKEHRFVRLDVLIVAGESRPVMRIDHTAIYEVRKLAAAD